MLCAAARKLSQKLACLEGSTASMESPAEVKRPYEQAERNPLHIASGMGGRKCRLLPLSQSCERVHNGGTVGEWLLGIGGGLAVMFI